MGSGGTHGESFTRGDRLFAGDVPRRLHRPRDPWPSLELSPRELAASRRMAPVVELVSVLAFDACFLEAVEEVRRGGSPDAVAARYVWREGRTRRVVRELLVVPARERPEYPAHPILALAGFAEMVGSQLDPGSSKEWPHAKRRDAAIWLARVGARRCIHCNAPLASDGGRRRYCTTHTPRGRRAERSSAPTVTRSPDY